MGKPHNQRRARTRRRDSKSRTYSQPSGYNDPNATITNQSQLLSTPGYLEQHPFAARFQNGQYPSTEESSTFNGSSLVGQYGGPSMNRSLSNVAPMAPNYPDYNPRLNGKIRPADPSLSPNYSYIPQRQSGYPQSPSSMGYSDNGYYSEEMQSHGSNGSFAAYQNVSPTSIAHPAPYTLMQPYDNAHSIMPDMEPDYPSIPQTHTAPTQEDLEAEDDWSEEVNNEWRNGCEPCPRN